MLFMLHISCLCIFMHAYLHFFIFLYWFVWCFSASLFLPLFLALVCSMAPKRKSTPSQNPLRSGASSSSSPSDPIPSHIWFSDDKLVKTFWRTSHDEAFIQNAKSLYRIFSILTFPLSSIVRVKSHYVASYHLSFRDHTGVLLQYARIWLFCDKLTKKKLTIDFPSHFILSLIDVYKDTTTCDKLIFPSAITRILHHFSISYPKSPHFSIICAIDAATIRQSEALLAFLVLWVYDHLMLVISIYHMKLLTPCKLTFHLD